MSLGDESEAVSPDREPDSSSADPTEAAAEENGVSVGEYTWDDFRSEFDSPAGADGPDDEPGAHDPGASPELTPETITDHLDTAIGAADRLQRAVPSERDPATIPVTVGTWTWHDHVRAVHDADYVGVDLPTEFDLADDLGHEPAAIPHRLFAGESAAAALSELIDERTVDIAPDLDEDAFFSSVDGTTTIVNRYDLEKAVPLEKKQHFREEDRYWVNKPFAFVVIFHSEKENETKYYLIEPYLTEIEDDLLEFLSTKLRTSIKYADDMVIEGGEANRRSVIDHETMELLERYDIYEEPAPESPGLGERIRQLLGRGSPAPDDGPRELQGIEARPEPAILDADPSVLTEYQVEKLRYRLKRDFIGYERIDGIKHDINVEDISCDGYNSPVFVYHTDYEQIISNVHHGQENLDDFVVKLAQRSGKGISMRQPQVDATLPDGSRAQLTLGREVSDHGTNYTIRQFKDVPFTPIDLINWRTFSLEEMAFLWLCIENHKSLIFAGGTASGKTTSLNAVSLFIPSNTKIVSIEDTREVELPQRNWIASVTRPSFSDDGKGDVDEFDLLEAALRQRPDYIVMGEIRGEEGRTLFQVMSTGHTTYTTFHADSVGEVLKRFTTAPINVSKTMFTALDLVSIQTSTRVQGHKVRRNKSLTEINHYDPENDEINVRDVYQWRAETDEFVQMANSNTLDEILFDRGWDRERLEAEQFKREVVIAYLIQNGLNEYRQVAATLQAFIADPETTISLIASGDLEESLEDLREMESVLIDVDPEKEAMVPRPDPDDALLEETEAILERAEEDLFPEYRTESTPDLVDTLPSASPAPPVAASPIEGESGTPIDEQAGEGSLETQSDESISADEMDSPDVEAGGSAVDASADAEGEETREPAGAHDPSGGPQFDELSADDVSDERGGPSDSPLGGADFGADDESEDDGNPDPGTLAGESAFDSRSGDVDPAAPTDSEFGSNAHDEEYPAGRADDADGIERDEETSDIPIIEDLKDSGVDEQPSGAGFDGGAAPPDGRSRSNAPDASGAEIDDETDESDADSLMDVDWPSADATDDDEETGDQAGSDADPDRTDEATSDADGGPE